MSERGRVKGGLREIHSSTRLDRRQDQNSFPLTISLLSYNQRGFPERYDYEHKRREGE